jgi:hypothetical protein
VRSGHCERPEPGDEGFDEALARVNAFADECRRRGVYVAGPPLQGEHTATTVSVREGRTLITDGPMAEQGSIEVRPIVSVPGLAATGE